MEEIIEKKNVKKSLFVRYTGEHQGHVIFDSEELSDVGVENNFLKVRMNNGEVHNYALSSVGYWSMLLPENEELVALSNQE